MKIIITTLLVAAATQGISQSLYVKIHGGYSFSAASDVIDEDRTQLYSKTFNPTAGHFEPAFRSEYRAVRGSYGQGLAIMATAGLTLSEHFSIELAFDYGPGKRFTSHTYSAEITDGVVDRMSITNREKYARSLLVSPAVLVKTDIGGFKPYLGVGPAAAKVRLWHEEHTVSTFPGDDSAIRRKQEFSGGVSIGIRGVAGIERTIRERVAFFAECGFVSMSYRPKQMELTRFERNNADILADLPVNQKKVLYKNDVVADTRDNIAEAEHPRRELPVSFALSKLTTTVGVRFGFGG